MLLRFGLLLLALPEHSSADRLVLHPEAVLKLQIKTSTAERGGGWHFNISKGFNHSPGGLRPYAASDFDLLAFVVLPENVVRFSRDRRPAHRILRSEIAGLRADPRASLEEALLSVGLAAPAAPDERAAPQEDHALIPWARAASEPRRRQHPAISVITSYSSSGIRTASLSHSGGAP